MREYITDEHIGKLAYKKRGFFGGLVGIIVATEIGYAIQFPSMSRIVITTTDDIEFVDEEGE